MSDPQHAAPYNVPRMRREAEHSPDRDMVVFLLRRLLLGAPESEGGGICEAPRGEEWEGGMNPYPTDVGAGEYVDNIGAAIIMHGCIQVMLGCALQIASLLIVIGVICFALWKLT